MPTVRTRDGVDLYYEEAGEGVPIVFVHEFAGDLRSYETQMRYFARRYRCIAYNARGYPPSSVPEDPAMYSQAIARDDVLAVLDGLGIDKAHVVGISMGGFAAVHFGISYPERARSLVVGGCGYGAHPDMREQFKRDALAAADRIDNEGMVAFGEVYAATAARVQLMNKDPRGFAEFKLQFQEHSRTGSALTMRGCQAARPSLYDLHDELAGITVPTLLVNGDEDEPCLDAQLYMKRTIPSSALVLFPRTGHALNLEEPEMYNRVLDEFFHQVEAGRWGLRDPRASGASILGQR